MRGLIYCLANAAVYALAVTPVAAPAAEALAYGPVPAWVVPQAAATVVSGESGAPVRILLNDVQLNLAPTLSESYVDSVLLIQTPQGLANAGNIAVSWRPETDVVTVHKLQILRDDRKLTCSDRARPSPSCGGKTDWNTRCSAAF